MNAKFSEAFAQIIELYTNGCELAAERKRKSDELIIGYLCSYVPEELFYAAGVTPFRITGDTGAISGADVNLQTYYCTFARSCLHKGLQGDYDFMDGVAIAATCDTIVGLHGIWSRNIKGDFQELIVVPTNVDGAEAHEFFTLELARVKGLLEKLTGKVITDDDLRGAINLCNHSRRLLEQLSKLREGKQPQLSGAEFFKIVRAGMVTPKNEYNRLLEELLSVIGDRTIDTQGKARVIISGSEIEDVAILELIEASGAHIVHEDTCYGQRYFGGEVSTLGDPLRALASRYLDKVPCPCKHSVSGRIDYLVRTTRELGAEAVIFTLHKFCDPHLFEYPYLLAELNKAGIQVQFLEIENSLSSPGSLAVRVEAFLEILKSKSDNCLEGNAEKGVRP